MPWSRPRRATSCARRSIDAQQFEQLLARARSGDGATARTALTEALALWRGEAYAEFAHEEWARAEVVRLTELRIAAVEELAELLIAADEHAAAIAMLEPVIDDHRFRDGLRGLLMRALARSGRQTEALRQFQAYRTLLAEEVGTEPSPELAALDAGHRRRGPTSAHAAARPHGRPASRGRRRAGGRSLARGVPLHRHRRARRGCGPSTPTRWPPTSPSTTSS